jgi:nucleoside-diphosphate kinase
VLERTLVLLKPDAVQRGLMGQVLQRFEQAGLKVVGCRMELIDDDLARRHYFDVEERHGAETFQKLVTFMQSGPVLALAIEGVEAIRVVRKLVGATFPDEALPGTIRGDFSHHSRAHSGESGKAIMNLVHASGNQEDAAHELGVWFTEGQLHSYATTAEPFTF